MIRNKKYFLLPLFLFFAQHSLVAQTITQKTIDSLNNVLKTTKDDTTKVMTLARLSWHFRIAGEKQKAKEAADSAVKIADKIDFKKGKATALNNLANLDWDAGNLDAAMDKFKLCARINKEIGNKLELGHNLNNIGNTYWARADYPEAVKHFKDALKSYEEAGNKLWMANTYNNLGSTFEQQGNYPEALKYFLDGLKILNENDNKQLRSILYFNVGEIHSRMMNYSEALKNYNIYLNISQEIGMKSNIARAYEAIGGVYEKQGNDSVALKNYLIAEKIFIETEDKGLLAGVYNSIGSVYLHRSNYHEALKNFNTAADMLKGIDYNEQLAVSYINIGDILSRQAAQEKDQVTKNKKYNEAIQVLNKGLSLAKETEAKENIKQGYKVLSDAYKGMHDYKQALEYNYLYVEIKDSLMNYEVARKLENQRTEYEVEKSVGEEKIKNQAALAQQKADLKTKNNLLLAGIAILVIVLFFIALLIRLRNQKKRAIERAEIGHKMAELELQSLRAQLNPHFMFNSLNAIQDLILKEDNDRSHLYLSRFAKLLRMLLDNANQPFVSVKQELEFLELYLSLENLRIPNLQFSIEKNSKINMEERMVPNMILQPYIENAIWHGLSNKKGERKLQIRIHENGNATEFEIEDNGIGRKKAEAIKAQYKQGHHSKGMELLSKRFDLLSKEYGDAIHTSVTDLENNGDAAGTLVKIDVPFTLSEQANQLINDTNHHT